MDKGKFAKITIVSGKICIKLSSVAKGIGDESPQSVPGPILGIVQIQWDYGRIMVGVGELRTVYFIDIKKTIVNRPTYQSLNLNDNRNPDHNPNTQRRNQYGANGAAAPRNF